MTDNMFTCHICAGTFEKAWTDEESDQEFYENFPGKDNKDAILLCDRCYYVA